jgi:SAM-dependent methyltransferase
VLDIGCGIGDFLKYRANSIGIDINPRIVDYCRIRGLNVQLCSEGDYPFKDDSFNGAIMDNVLEHIVDPLPTLAEIKRVLISGSTLIVGVPGSRGFMSDPDHKISYDEKSMATTLYSEGFILTRVIHAPFKSAFFDRHMRQYCIYGVFHLQ